MNRYLLQNPLNLLTKFRFLSSKAGAGGEVRLPDNSKCINKVILLGRSVNDSQIRPLNNTHYTTFIIATNEMRKTKSNELVKRSDFHKVFVYQPFLAKKAHDLITKGTRIYLEGKLNYRKYDNQFFSNIVAEKLIFISGTNQNYDVEGNEDDVEELDETFLQEGNPDEKAHAQSK